MGNNMAAASLYSIAHSKYGKRLTPHNYSELLSCQTVSEVATYLKTKTNYSEALENIKNGDIHRGHLEQLIRKHIFNESLSICSFEISVGDPFFEYIILKGEADQILSFVRYFNAGRPQEYVFALPDFFDSHADIDLVTLSKARDFRGILDSLKSSQLKKILEPIRNESDKIDYTLVEFILRKYLYKRVKELIGHLSPGAKADISKMFGIKSDLANAERIYRLKYLGYNDPAYLKSTLYEDHYKLNQHRLDSMINAKDTAGVVSAFKESWYGKYFEIIELQNIDHFLKSIYYLNLKYLFRFSTHPIVAVMTYLELKEIELKNIIRIIEGIRYKLSRTDIGSLLIGVDI